MTQKINASQLYKNINSSTRVNNNKSKKNNNKCHQQNNKVCPKNNNANNKTRSLVMNSPFIINSLLLKNMEPQNHNNDKNISTLKLKKNNSTLTKFDITNSCSSSSSSICSSSSSNDTVSGSSTISSSSCSNATKYNTSVAVSWVNGDSTIENDNSLNIKNALLKHLTKVTNDKVNNSVTKETTSLTSSTSVNQVVPSNMKLHEDDLSNIDVKSLVSH